MSERAITDDTLVSVVLPVYNEAAALHQLHAAVTGSLASVGCRLQIVFVNDGSSDGSGQIIDELSYGDDRVLALHLSRNFGHQAAVQAGLAHATGDAVIVMDSDLQDDPSCLVDFVRQWQAGFDVVYAVRKDRKEGPVKRGLYYAFYRLLNMVSQTPIPNDAGNFGLIDRRVAICIRQLGEHDRFYPGLRSWVGFRQTGVPVERLARYDDHPRVSLLGLCSLAKTALFSFSSVPLLVFYALGGISLLVCGGFTLFALYHKFSTGLALPGWTSMIVIASFFGAINAIGIAVLGEYVVRIYDQVRGRPKYIVARHECRAAQHEPAQIEERIEDIIAGLNEPLMNSS
jgi:dolichol-phosphate mannosyltransferase